MEILMFAIREWGWWLYLGYDIDIRNYIYEFMKQVKILSVVIRITHEWYPCYESKRRCYHEYASCEDKFVEYVGYFNVISYDHSYNMLLYLGIYISPHCVNMHYIVKTGNWKERLFSSESVGYDFGFGDDCYCNHGRWW